MRSGSLLPPSYRCGEGEQDKSQIQNIHTHTCTHTGANEIYPALLFCTNMDPFSLNTDLIPVL